MCDGAFKLRQESVQTTWSSHGGDAGTLLAAYLACRRVVVGHKETLRLFHFLGFILSLLKRSRSQEET